MFWSQILSTFEWESVLQILLAVVLGGAVGLEREFSGRPAGLRTHILVCMGSTIIVLTSTAVPRLFGESYHEVVRVDPGRIAAGIVTGIGFLGAGAILRKGSFVRGLTTAACIWFAAALGIVIGMRFYPLAVCSTLIVILVLRVDDLFETRISSPIYRVLTAVVSAKESKAFSERCRTLLKQHRIRIQDVDYAYDREGDVVKITFHIKLRRALESPMIVDDLVKEAGVQSIRWQD